MALLTKGRQPGMQGGHTMLTLGTYVRNFGQIAKVVAYHEVSGDYVLQGTDGKRWLADPHKCESAEVPQYAYCHKEGLVSLG
jgi:hypothetical protein